MHRACLTCLTCHFIAFGLGDTCLLHLGCSCPSPSVHVQRRLHPQRLGGEAGHCHAASNRAGQALLRGAALGRAREGFDACSLRGLPLRGLGQKPTGAGMLCSSSATAQQLYSPHGRVLLRSDQARVFVWLCSCSCHAWRSCRRASHAGNRTRTATGSSGGLGWLAGEARWLVQVAGRPPPNSWVACEQPSSHLPVFHLSVDC